MDRGVLYTATGATYVEQAVVSISSLRRWNPDLDVAVFTDDPEAFAGLAAHVTPVSGDLLPASHPPEQRMLPRLQCLRSTPFERTLALDTDTVVMGPIGDVFDVLDRVSVGICHGHQRALRYGAAMRAGKAKEETPYAFAPVQGGVILYDGGPGRRFVDDVVRAYEDKRYVDDQVSMREVLWEADYRFTHLPPEYNIWRLGELDRWSAGGFREAWPRIFHTVLIKDRLTPSEIDQLLLPLAERAARHQTEGASSGPHRSSGAEPSTVAGRLSGLRTQAGRWRSDRRLRRRLHRARSES